MYIRWIAFVLLISACRPSAVPITEVVLYSHDFKYNGGGWQTMRTLLQPNNIPSDSITCWTSWLGLPACTIPAPVENGSLKLESPWWVDNNHAPPGGASFFSLLSYVYVNGREGSFSTNGIPHLNLENTTLELEIRSANLNLKSGHLYFWFQSYMPDRRSANFAYTGMPLDALFSPDSNTPQTVKIELRPDSTLWTCLGSAVSRIDTYGCIPLTDAMRKVDVDFGFIILPVNGSPAIDIQPSGKIFIKSIAIKKKL